MDDCVRLTTILRKRERLMAALTHDRQAAAELQSVVAIKISSNTERVARFITGSCFEKRKKSLEESEKANIETSG